MNAYILSMLDFAYFYKCILFLERKRMKNIINNIEKEIEEQLDMQTEENDFITTNVFAIVKVSCPTAAQVVIFC